MKEIQQLEKLGACQEAIDWLKNGNFKTFQEAWDKCERGDWMLWLLGKLCGSPRTKSRKKLALCSCDCAWLVRKYATGKTKKPFYNAIKTTRSLANGKETTVQEVRDAAHVAYAAGNVVAYAVAYAATDAAAHASNAAAYAAGAAAHAADVATLAVYADNATDVAALAVCAANAADSTTDIRTQTLKQCADIARKHYPVAPKIEVKK